MAAKGSQEYAPAPRDWRESLSYGRDAATKIAEKFVRDFELEYRRHIKDSQPKPKQKKTSK
jgi:hypothetical protein